MATKVVMEALSPTMEEGRLVKWLKHEGDAVKTGDVLAEVETDKAVMELVARGDGVVRKLVAAEGDASPVGTLIAVIAAPDENIDALLAEAGSRASSGGNGAQPAAPAAEPAADASQQAVPTPVPTGPTDSQGEAAAQAQPSGGAEPTAAPPQPPPPPRTASPRPAAPQAPAAPA